MSESAFSNSLVEISHIGDYSHPVPEGALLVEDDLGYVNACHALRALSETSKHLQIWVRQETHFHWLRCFTEQTEIVARCERKTPRLVLADRWGTSVPEWLF